MGPRRGSHARGELVGPESREEELRRGPHPLTGRADSTHGADALGAMSLLAPWPADLRSDSRLRNLLVVAESGSDRKARGERATRSREAGLAGLTRWGWMA